MRGVIGLAGITLVAAGIALNFHSPTVADGLHTIQCGVDGADARKEDLVNLYRGTPSNLGGQCAEELETLEFAQWGLLGIGGFTFLGALAYRGRSSTP